MHSIKRFLDKTKMVKRQSDEQLESDLLQGLFSLPDSLRKTFVLNLDYQNFEQHGFVVTKMLMDKGYIFRIYELTKKYPSLIHINSEKNKVTRNLSSCLTKKFNVFHLERIKAKN